MFGRGIRQAQAEADAVGEFGVGLGGEELLWCLLHGDFELGAGFDEALDFGGGVAEERAKVVAGDGVLGRCGGGYYESLAAYCLRIEKAEGEVALLVPQFHAAGAACGGCGAIGGDVVADEVAHAVHR
ncbi:MAG: hypothetical protein B7Z55_14790, partial [Planctomycetales bacterium 12-60-4]